VAKEMLINVSQGEECRIAVVEDGRLEELYMERTSSTSHVGNIYKGKVTNVEPSIQAAFIDFGLGRNGFLHISDLMPTYFGQGSSFQETVGRKLSRRDRPPIQRCLRRGDEIIVQIIKEGIGTKGPTLTTYLSIPGRILVMMPGMGKMGISRKIEDEEDRRRLRQILNSLKPPKDVGFIIRTAGIGKTKLEIQRDLTYLTRVWQTFEKKRDSGPGPTELYTEGDLVTRTVRDVFTSDIERIVVDDKNVAKRVKEVIKLANPRTKNKVDLYEEPVPLFHKYGIEREIEQMYSRHVPLPSGGSLVIDSTEAIVAIDVNSGKFREHADAETTAFKTDLEAADEIPRQLRLRDLGGVIICDFIDLRFDRHRRELEERLHANFEKDRAKTKVLRMSQFGIIELTRQRMRPSLKRSIYFDCPHCKGSGLIKTPESMSLDVMRRLAIAVHDERVARVEINVAPDVSFNLQNRKREQIAKLEYDTNKSIIVRPDAAVSMDEVRIELFDGREGSVYLQELGMIPPGMPQSSAHGRHDQGRGGRGNRGGRGGRDDHRNKPAALPPPRQSRRDQERDNDLDRENDLEDHGDLDRDVDAEGGEENFDREDSRPPARANDSAGPEESGAIGDDRPRQGDDRPREGDDTGPRRRRRRRGGRGRNRNRQFENPDQIQPQEQSVGDHGYVDEYDVGDDATDSAEDAEGDERDDRAIADNRDNRPPHRDTRNDNRRGRDVESDVEVIGEDSVEEEIEGEIVEGSIETGRGRDDRDALETADGGESQGNLAGGHGSSEGSENLGPDGQPRRRRRRRGGRGRRRNRGQDSNFPNAGGPPNINVAASTNEIIEDELPDDVGNVRPPDPIDEDLEEAEDHLPQPGNEAMPPEPVETEKPRRRRGRRGGRNRRGRSGPNADAPGYAPQEIEPPVKPSGRAPQGRQPQVRAPQPSPKELPPPVSEAPVRATPARRAPRPIDDTTPRATEAKDVARTGSADRHLVHDEPIEIQPITRPRSYTDLDSIPDDFDERT